MEKHKYIEELLSLIDRFQLNFYDELNEEQQNYFDAILQVRKKLEI